MKRFSKLPSDGEEGISVGISVCGVDVIAKGWLEELCFLQVDALVLENLRFLPVATSARDGAP